MNLLLQQLKVFLKTNVKKCREISCVCFSGKYLLFTNLGISVSLSSVGDTIEQYYEIYKEELDEYKPTRTVHMAVSGATVGVICHFWYKYLDGRFPGRSLSIVMKKVALDQVICSPLVISAFFLTLGLLENSSKKEIIHEIKTKAWRLYAAEWVVWPPAQIINFYWLPNRYRVLYDNTISLGYDVYTSKVKHGK